jgi:hypothetical protein
MSAADFPSPIQPTINVPQNPGASFDMRKPAEPDAAGPSFSQVMGQVQQSAGTGTPPVPRWRSLGFLATQTVPRITWPWTYTNINRAVQAATTTLQSAVDAVSNVAAPAFWADTDAMPLSSFPVPPGNNGRGVHWIPTVSQTPDVVDKFVAEAAQMGMKWVLFLNEGANIGANDYLVQRLKETGIEPMMRIYTPGLAPVDGDIKEMVSHYTQLGINYFQLYNEPNLMVETGGQYPNVDQYLDLWVPAAQQVLAGGGLPGLGALSPQGEMDDRDYLRQTLEKLKARGQAGVLNKSWLAMHNYTGPRPMEDPDGFMRFRQYDTIIRAALGRQMPIIGTEGGTHITEHVSEAQQVAMVTDAYKYMENREPYNFAYTYWILANGPDPAWEEHALIRKDGPTALAQTLKNTASNQG